jgi:hypothetical protein
VQNIEPYKKLPANASRYCFVISSTNDMVGISRFLEMKMKAVTFKVYTSKSWEINNCFRAKVRKVFSAGNSVMNAIVCVS